jgi:basic endochitinase B
MYYCWASCEGGTVGWKNRMSPTVGANILNNPNLVSTDGIITWKTAIWYWMNHGKDWDPAKQTPHVHIAPGGPGFGETTKDINGGLECGQPVGSVGYNQMQSRVSIYNTFLSNLGVSDTRTKTC